MFRKKYNSQSEVEKFPSCLHTRKLKLKGTVWLHSKLEGKKNKNRVVIIQAISFCGVLHFAISYILVPLCTWLLVYSFTTNSLTQTALHRPHHQTDLHSSLLSLFFFPPAGGFRSHASSWRLSLQACRATRLPQPRLPFQSCFCEESGKRY